MTELNDPEKGIFPGLECKRDQFGECGCWSCVEKLVDFSKGIFMPFIVCPDCGNKRCPKAMLHSNACTGSNAMAQEGSRFADVGWCKNCDDAIVQATFGEVRRAAELMGLKWNGSPKYEGSEGPKIWRHRDTGLAACREGRKLDSEGRMLFAVPE